MISKRFTRKSLAATAAACLAALGVGGAALAQSNSSTTPQKAETPASEVRETPGQEAPESSAPENSAADRDNVQDENGKDDAKEGPEQEAKEVPGDDGPGGHADEPGNPNADHQFEGKE